MTLRVRDVLIAAFVAFVAWGFLISWAPILRYLGYAFTAGVLTSFFAFLGLIILSTNVDHGVQQRAIKSPSIPIFTTPKAWEEETQRLSENSLYKQDVIYPPSFVISQNIDTLLDWILRDFVTTWYSRISTSPAFINEIDRSIRAALIDIRKRLFARDIVEVVVSRIVPLVTKHLKDFYEAERAVRGINLNRNVTESDELDLAIASKYKEGALHPAASLKHSDLQLVQQEYLRRLVIRVLPQVLPESMIKSRTVTVLIKELVSCAVLTPLMKMISDPDSWNQLMEAYGRTMIQDRKTVRKLRAALDQHASPPPKPPKPHAFPKLSSGDDERKFERFVRSIRQCSNLSDARRFRSEVASQLRRERTVDGQDQIYLRRLETGKQLLDQRVAKLSAVGNALNMGRSQSDNKNSLSSSKAEDTSLREVLYDAAGLSYFMEFMDRRRRMTLVQFWIVVDGIRNPLEEDVQNEDPFANAQTRWNESDRTDLAQINEAYLSKPEIHAPKESQEAVQTFLRNGTEASMAQYKKARTAVLRVQSAIFSEMNESHFPEFKKSDLFYKYLSVEDSSTRIPIKPQTRAMKQPSVASIPESPSRPLILSRLSSGLTAGRSELKRNAASSSDLKASMSLADKALEGCRSLDFDTSKPLFDDDIEDDHLARSTHSLDNESLNGVQAPENQDQMVDAVEAALSTIMTDDARNDGANGSVFDSPESNIPNARIFDSPRSSGEFKRTDTLPSNDREKDRPNLASLGLVNTSSRIGVFTDNDLFGDEEKFLEDEQPDPELSADEKPVDEEIHQAAPGDLGLAEAITALTADIDRLCAQESVVDTLTRKAELTNNVAELRILGKSKSSLQREIRRKELQRQQYIVQESDNSLYGRANVSIKSIMAGREGDGQEFALYVIEVQRKAGEHMSTAGWAVARRYSEFHDLHQRLRQIYPAVRHLEFPRRRLVMKLQREFLHKRRIQLQQYLRQLLQLPAVCRSRDLRAFLSQSAIISSSDTTRDGERRDIISRIYNSVTDGMDEFLGNVPVLDQLSIAGQNLISAATSQFNTMNPNNTVNPTAGASNSLPIAPEDPIQTDEARAELLAFEPNSTNTMRAEQLEPFVKPISDIFLETFDLQRGNNWLRGRAVVVVLHQLLGGTVERRVRETVKAVFAESAVLRYIDMLKDVMWPDGQIRKDRPVRTEAEKAKSKLEASVMLSTLVPDLAGNVVGKANAQAASRRLTATVNNDRLNAHLAFVILDEVVDVLFPREVIKAR
ncbi:MAG: tRNA (guanine-N(7)-)-methyltransferase (tRNA(m7G46)-methyltransferase) [Ramalina farinacea]|uniref:tRNA (Guanine-N(7)-)-methyltransferase (tRNA(m7G46)-methyltransferase) n=1 Tax=Ramalina farinacea TaxID=258253 RepID=A0AA43QUS1_9LECA|nr:tRNA (guanine-N(7)-)-methyltransferase (tRNA(m7G46)-methyltransferase) [Ramalina farinacea]